MNAHPTPQGPAGTPARAYPIAIEDVSSWVLRIGVVASVLVMLFGLVLSFAHGGVTRHLMETQTLQMDLGALRQGLAGLQGFAWLELGIFLLIATPILRVFTAMVLFAVEERDGLYTTVTFLVLLMTLGSLLFIR
ncbi:MAG: DUF1634 domain-containing protein [Gemmatimonadota bacterium]|nr:DUF1634 domain-containing protein [Gemmatimonadota bacterium]MDE3215562.1 DUF1634 domain-containing protein [Gemmatimonadota bacterium]